MRTTLDIDDPILRDLKRLQKLQGKSLGRLVSDLLAEALHAHGVAKARQPPFEWLAKPMSARVDLADKHAVLDALDDPRP